MKFQRTYEDENMIEVWSFDTDRFANGPISVDIKYKNGFDKKWSKIQKEAKDDRRVARQIKKINEKNNK
jgi:hypothetical protein